MMQSGVCHNRIRYRTEQRANNAIASGTLWCEPGWKLIAHHCDECGGWHINTEPDRVFYHGSVKHAIQMCTRKSWFNTLENAYAAIDRAREDGKNLRAYLCPYCGKYHLTKQRISQT